MRLGAPHVPSKADRVLADAIVRRHTDRLAYEERALAPHVLALLLASAAAEGAWLVPVETPARRAVLAALVAPADRTRVECAPVMAVLATVGDAPRDWLVAGQALGRVLLAACASGVAASFMNQPLEVPALLRAADDPASPGDAAVPQLVLRFGYAPEGRTTPRRPLHDVLR
ncbi:hypothetical protein [Roseisolibacter agri]|uniref:Nitroreductase family protein n=1 Tax=Roseisolibacter agri TaxID=2014610 RepID=A0AA37V654_9BACT|nr:hypothetical protein [Roseisolibacter agri]GLC24881.1 hypothetical protein rosag_13940 [Roseisolibacter agri]